MLSTLTSTAVTVEDFQRRFQTLTRRGSASRSRSCQAVKLFHYQQGSDSRAAAAAKAGMPADVISSACRDFLNGLRLPLDLAPALIEKVKTSALGCDQDVQVIQKEDSAPRVVARRALEVLHVWIIPHVLSTTRSTLFRILDTNPEILSECVRLMRLPESSSVDVVFSKYWSWCVPDAYDSSEESLMELKWHLLPKSALWIPHADEGNVAVCPLPPSVTSLLMLDSAPHGASMMFQLNPIKEGQVLKRDHLPVKRTLQRVARLISLIGDDPARWAHHTERDGLNQVFQSAAPNPPPPWDPVKDISQKGDGRPRMAATEFCPLVYKVFTDYPNVAQSLSHSAFNMVATFDESHILFAGSPVSGFFGLAHRMVNQFPHEQCLINPRMFMNTVRLSAQPPHGGRVTDQNQQAQSLPAWFPLMFDLKTEVNHFLAEYRRRTKAGKDNYWQLYSSNFEDCNWCLTDDKCTIVKYGEANAGNWVVYKAVHPPLLLDARKLELSVFVVVRSFEPLEAYIHEQIIGRLAKKPYTIDARSLHLTEIHMSLNPLESSHIPRKELVKAVMDTGINWDDLEAKVQESVSELLDAARVQVGEWPRSRALYRVDFALPKPVPEEEFFPKILGVGFAPDLTNVLREDPIFVNDVFEALFLDSPVPKSMSKLPHKA